MTVELAPVGAKIERRRIRKFPAYEIGSDKVIRHIRYDRVVTQYRSPYCINGAGNKALLLRGSVTFEAHVNELYYDAFPEMRG